MKPWCSDSEVEHEERQNTTTYQSKNWKSFSSNFGALGQSNVYTLYFFSVFKRRLKCQSVTENALIGEKNIFILLWSMRSIQRKLDATLRVRDNAKI